jgi:hypothetical protein
MMTNGRSKRVGLWTVRTGQRRALPGLATALLLACAPSDPLSQPSGLESADGTVSGGWRRTTGGCGSGGLQLHLAGPHWGTQGWVPAEVSREDAGVDWLYFPIQTAVGEGTAALRVEGQEALLPLGARPGELEIALRLTPANEAPDEARALARSAAQIEAAKSVWARGFFSLRGPDGPAGDLDLGYGTATVALYSPVLATAGGAPIPARRRLDGPDLLLEVPIEPSLHGELGSLRFNLATWTVIFPAGETPSDDDLHFQAEALEGVPDRAAAWSLAREAADEAELAWLDERLPRLAAQLRRPQGDCLIPADLDPSWGLLLQGYRVTVEAMPGRCLLSVAPDRPQHRRRATGTWGPAGRTADPS